MKSIITIITILLLLSALYLGGAPPLLGYSVCLLISISTIVVYHNRSTMTGASQSRVRGNHSTAVSGTGNIVGSTIHNYFRVDDYESIMRKYQEPKAISNPKLHLDHDAIRTDEKQKLVRLYHEVFIRNHKKIEQLLNTGKREDAENACIFWMTLTVFLNYHRDTIFLLRPDMMEKHVWWMIKIKNILIEHPHAKAFMESMGIDWNWDPDGVSVQDGRNEKGQTP